MNVCKSVCVPDKHAADPRAIYSDVRTHTSGTNEHKTGGDDDGDYFLLHVCSVVLL